MFSDGEDGCIDLANEITKMGPNTKHFDIDKNIHKKIINKKITNLKMNSYCIADDIDSNINEEKLNLMNNQSYKIKSNSTENLYATPNKSEMDNRRITSRKIQRKTNDIFLQKNNLLFHQLLILKGYINQIYQLIFLLIFFSLLHLNF